MCPCPGDALFLGRFFHDPASKIPSLKEHIAMQMTGAKRTASAVLVSCLAVLSLRAGAQQKPVIESVSGVAPVQGLHRGAFFPMGTTRPGSREQLQKLASPFSGTAAAAPTSSNGRRYPADLTYQGGLVIQNSTQHAVFVNPSSGCPANSCWGNPIGFLSDFSYSSMIHVTDPYVGSNSGNRYPVGTNYKLTGFTSLDGGTAFTDFDMANIAYYIASVTNGFGSNNMYHLFLVPGQDVCFDNTYKVCYSPDHNATFDFCAYHSYAYDNAGNTVFYSVEPFNGVDGCSVKPGTPNGVVEDSTNNSLSHEEVETITDGQGDGWWNTQAVALFGEENSDECSFVTFTATNAYFDPSTVRLNHKWYAIQPEYSNQQHACVTGPGID
jgi:hypothetical protein